MDRQTRTESLKRFIFSETDDKTMPGSQRASVLEGLLRANC